MQIAWPVQVDTKIPVGSFDLLLATATRPTPDSESNDYPSPEQIAEAWRRTGKFQYFNENRKHGFHTFQDDEIIRNLERLTSGLIQKNAKQNASPGALAEGSPVNRCT